MPAVAAAVRHRPTAELSKLYVHPDQHGGGVASALVERALHAAVDEGAVSVWLGVNIHNARANRFYEKSGFAIVGTKLPASTTCFQNSRPGSALSSAAS